MYIFIKIIIILGVISLTKCFMRVVYWLEGGGHNGKV